ncbi:hypothetical protein PI172_0291 [Prevotella intermedia]|uniref:Uncharacterized protein n=1 Tax=Prevotella intermedia TaxID=28131 RepID=A0AAD1BG36_PREIN|nr:hypothetical protein PI172_0291 [Prevotella intermedia]
MIYSLTGIYNDAQKGTMTIQQSLQTQRVASIKSVLKTI